MKNKFRVGFALAFVATALVGCGSSGGDDDPVDGAVQIDARVDGSITIPDARIVDAFVQPDAAPPGMCNGASTGTKGVFQACLSDSECIAGSECLTIGSGKFCLRCCDGTGTGPNAAACDVQTSCVQNGAPTLSATAKVLENHCWFTGCGGGTGNGDGSLRSACKVGKDLWAQTTPAANFTDGWCLTYDDGDPINMTAPEGTCMPNGTLAKGAACALQSTLGAPDCGQNLTCIGRSGQTMGTCAEVCDPRPSTDTCADTGFDCQDASELQGTSIGSYGFCVMGKRCSVLNDAADCAGVQQNFGGTFGMLNTVCNPTTGIRPNGLCSFPQGTAAADAACKNSAYMTVADFCGSGFTCGADSTVTTPATCLQWCDNPNDMQGTCPTGKVCKKYLWDANAAGPADDQYSSGYGVCAAP